MRESPLTSVKRKSKKRKSQNQSKKVKGEPSSKGHCADGEAPRKLAHKEELAAIAKNDPEFFEFLQQQDADLLQFNESDVNSMSGGM
ncbi:hypothetical protein Tcan_17929 [Toxocara canis]|uniref:Uncharacterized protein n=1 Tax=Toxocara canis TaxID=6265 RepID=A0A0B2W2A0_TOXCA|nr:hypothetical protein Tcan_17929 [Toxocara canis]